MTGEDQKEQHDEVPLFPVGRRRCCDMLDYLDGIWDDLERKRQKRQAKRYPQTNLEKLHNDHSSVNPRNFQQPDKQPPTGS